MNASISLYDCICSYTNLYLAYRNARRGKRGKPSVASFEYNQEDELLQLQKELFARTWQPGPYRSFYIKDPKRRLISAAPFRDRVVHHALCQQIEPLWERRFIYDSYANRVAKGTHRALLRTSQFARRYRYVLQCDIQQYFPAIDHAILSDILARLIQDPHTLNLVHRILASGLGLLDQVYRMHWFPGDDLWAIQRPRGLPIGNLTSQFWANVYLDGFDHFVKRQLGCKGYLRYVDDFLLFSDDKRILWEWKKAITERLAGLRLTLHTPQVYPVNTGIPFLGFRIYPTHRRLKQRKGYAFRRHLRLIYQQWLDGALPRDNLDATARSWAAHAAWGDTHGLRRAILGSLDLSAA